METLYHITSAKNLDSILIEGLIPGKRKGLTLQSRGKLSKVFLTNDVDRIAITQAGKNWIERNKAIVIEVSVSNTEPHKYVDGGTYTLSDYEFVCDRVNPADIVRWFEYSKSKEK